VGVAIASKDADHNHQTCRQLIGVTRGGSSEGVCRSVSAHHSEKCGDRMATMRRRDAGAIVFRAPIPRNGSGCATNARKEVANSKADLMYHFENFA